MNSSVLHSITRDGSLRAIQLSSEGLYPASRKTDPAVRNLALAILIQAFRDVVARRKEGLNRQASAWRQDAIDWFFDNSPDPGSFEWVRDILGVGAMELRKWVQAYQASNQTEKTEMLKQLRLVQMPH